MGGTLLSLRGLSIDFVRGNQRRRILDDINIDVAGDRVLGILGESGSGKTTLARAMVGWVSEPLQIASGEMLYRGRDLRNPHVQREARQKIGFIGADPGNAFDPTLPVGNQIAEKLRAVRPDIGNSEAQKHVIDLLDAVRIPSAKSRYSEFPNQYSGGMLQRAVIVDALITEPELLICDNMIQSLDVTVAAQIIRLLREMRGRISAGIVFISTSVASVAEVADETLVLACGRVVEKGEPEEVARNPKNPITRELVARTPRIWTGNETAGEPLPDSRERPILQVQDVTKTYHKKDHSKFFGHQHVQAVRGVSFNVFPGDNFGLVGESGCGKSTLSRLLSWVEKPDQGSIKFEGRDISTMNRRERLAMRKGFQLLLQDPYSCLPPHLPVGRSIGLALEVHGVGRKEIDSRVRDVMREVGLSLDDLHSLPVGMSAGQRQRVNVARALVLEPRLMILDETLSALDPVEQSRLLTLFEQLQVKHGLTYLFISHDLAMVRRVCTRIGVMYLGKMVEVADTGGTFYDPGHPYTRALLSAVPTLDANPYKPEDCLLDGEPPSPIDIPQGCSFASRCPHAFARCRVDTPLLHEHKPGRLAACHLLDREETTVAA
jgi:peptide/nickel transport system ATP-binding protein